MPFSPRFIISGAILSAIILFPPLPRTSDYENRIQRFKPGELYDVCAAGYIDQGYIRLKTSVFESINSCTQIFQRHNIDDNARPISNCLQVAVKT